MAVHAPFTVVVTAGHGATVAWAASRRRAVSVQAAVASAALVTAAWLAGAARLLAPAEALLGDDGVFALMVLVVALASALATGASQGRAGFP